MAKENPDNKYMVFGFKPTEADFTLQNLNDDLDIKVKKDMVENTFLAQAVK